MSEPPGVAAQSARYVALNQRGDLDPSAVGTFRQELEGAFDNWKQVKVQLLETELARFDLAVQRAMASCEQNGLLENLQHTLEEGNHSTILVHPVGSDDDTHAVEVKDARIAEVLPSLNARLLAELRAEKVPETHVERAAQLVFTWLGPRLPTTLTLDEAASSRARDEATLCQCGGSSGAR